MKAFIVFPTWLLVLLIIPWMRESHPWHDRTFSLSDWSQHATPLTRQFGAFFWLQIILIPVIIHTALKAVP